MRLKKDQAPLDALNEGAPSAPTEYRIATYMRMRTPELKVHRIKGHAVSALRYKSNNTRPWWLALPDTRVFEKHGEEWVDVTQEWIDADQAHYEAKAEKARKAEELRRLCYAPCSHCSLRPRN